MSTYSNGSVFKARGGNWRRLLELPRRVLEVLEGVVERMDLLCSLPGAEPSGVRGQTHGFGAARGGCGKQGRERLRGPGELLLEELRYTLRH